MKSLGKSAMVLLVCAFLLSSLNGCTGGGSDSGSYWNDTGETANLSGYTVSGVVKSPVSLAPVQGVTCSLETNSGTKAVISTTTTDSNGQYSFSGVTSGDYRLVTSKDGHYKDTTFLNVSSDHTVDLLTVKSDEWSTLMGSDHPYDSTKAYVSVMVDHTGSGTAKDPGKDGVKVELVSNTGKKGTGYEARGYINANGQMDWNSSASSSAGVALFYKTIPDDTYTMKASKDAHTFNDVTNVTPVKGEFTNYIMKGEPTIPTLSVRFRNNSKYYDDSTVYATVWGQGKTENDGYYHYYYSPKNGAMTLFTEKPADEDYQVPLTSLTKGSDGKGTYYSVTVPTDHMYSGRAYLSLGKKLTFTPDGPKKVLPPTVDTHKEYIFDFFELNCDGGMLWANSTCVDCMAFAYLLEVNGTDGSVNKKGFNVAKNSEVTDQFTTLDSSNPWKKCVEYDGKGNIMRIRSPKNMTGGSTEFATYLDGVISKAWDYYKNNTGTYTTPDGVWSWDISGDGTNLKIKCTKGAEKEKSYTLSKPTTWQVFANKLDECVSQTLTEGMGKCNAAIGASLCRGVMTECDNWNKSTAYYQKTDYNNDKYCEYGNFLHKKAVGNLIYAIPYDDVNDQAPLIVKVYDQVKNVTITVPEMPQPK